jgi:hypothetical protein
MESSDLFSHPDETVAVPATESSSEEVQAPAFSDAPQNAAAIPPTS